MLHEVLRLIRSFHNLSLSELSAKLNVSSDCIARIESGNRTPSAAILKIYSETFGMSVASLLFFSEDFHRGKITSRPRLVSAKFLLVVLKWIEKNNARKSTIAAKTK